MLTNLVEKMKEFNEKRAVLDEAGINSRVLLVDSMNTYIRCFCATPTMNDDGEHVGGVTGFLKSVGLAIRQFNPTRVICVFDGKGGSQRRRKLFENYKDKRRSMIKLNRTYEFLTIDEEKKALRWQLQLLVELLSHLPVTVMSVENIEADDTIGYLTRLITEKDGSCVIMSTDKDFLQLVNERVHVYNPIKKKMYAPQDIVEEYGIHPNNFLLYRMIEGDKSDNIEGVKGIGLATIKKNFPFLQEETPATLDNLLNACTGSKSAACKKLSEAIAEGKMERNKQLMELSDEHIAGTTRLGILDMFNAPVNPLSKYTLTREMSKFKLFAAFGNFDEWILTTWIPLTRYKQENV